LAAERSELERRVAARTASQHDAYRAQISLRVAAGQTDAGIAQAMGLAERTVWLWRHRFAEQRLDGLKDLVQFGQARLAAELEPATNGGLLPLRVTLIW